MKRTILVAALALLLLPSLLFAHGVEVSLASGETAFPAETDRFAYSTGEAMSFALIRVYAPSKPAVETVKSITDRNGYFSFIPDESGEWRITAEDGMGHKGEITVLAENGAEGAAASVEGERSAGSKTPLLFRITLGLSLILNIFAVYNFVLKNGGRKKDGSHAY
jgi:nickel transport protein